MRSLTLPAAWQSNLEACETHASCLARSEGFKHEVKEKGVQPSKDERMRAAKSIDFDQLMGLLRQSTEPPPKAAKLEQVCLSC